VTAPEPISGRLIIDVGMSEGNDTAFYLAKGFDVVGVEADPTLQPQLAQRFAAEIAAGRLHLLHRAAAARSGERLTFHHDPIEQGHSSAARGGHAGSRRYEVTTIAWPDLRAIAGVPYYMKLDIEGGEPAFLASMQGDAELPHFLSAEVANTAPIRQMHALGYRHFRLINQEMFGRITLPDPPREGRYVPRPPLHHWSGPFGRELPGSRWFDLDAIIEIYDTLHRLWELETLVTGWLDCHAALPKALQ
jgi:FkbM family methyltransferase